MICGAPNSSGIIVALAATVAPDSGRSISHQPVTDAIAIAAQKAGYRRSNRLIRKSRMPSSRGPVIVGTMT